MAVPDFEKGGGKSVCGGSAAADGIFEDCRGGCSTTRIVEVFPRRFVPLKHLGFFPLKAGNDGLRVALYLHILKANPAHVNCRLVKTSASDVAGKVTRNLIVQVSGFIVHP